MSLPITIPQRSVDHQPDSLAQGDAAYTDLTWSPDSWDMSALNVHDFDLVKRASAAVMKSVVRSSPGAWVVAYSKTTTDKRMV